MENHATGETLKLSHFMFPSNERKQSQEIIPFPSGPSMSTYTTAHGLLQLAKLNNIGCKNKGYAESKIKIQIYAYHNACNSFPLWDPVGWPSGSTSLLLFSAPERDGLYKVSLLLQMLLKPTHYKNKTLSSRAKIRNVPVKKNHRLALTITI